MHAARESVTIARQAVAGVADACGWPSDFVDDLKLAVSEAWTNAVVHAYPDRPDGDIELAVWIDEPQVRIAVRDHGVGISPRVHSSVGLGLGMPLMATLSDEMRVRTTTDGATEVAMTFTIPATTVPVT
jgi:anti-sigma regulatory factor (Ser/Thr protein kinase)